MEPRQDRGGKVKTPGAGRPFMGTRSRGFHLLLAVASAIRH
ncbi:hypothetical protein DCCM_0212 [Desulfocucumis palustris]|uniref:Uncharacterized protein n=1 Tax=Desulfocucumis palustris TaxID=1898651 RepID=A0A2L2XDW7_9FIRM|nr:hypothetical protein DCCM_0212 [Desulfocucumis palustris]